MSMAPAPPPVGQSKLLRYLFVHALLGAGSGVAVALAMVWTNVGGMADLIAGSEQPALPLALLVVFFALTFASLGMGAAVMTMPHDDDDDDDHGRGRRVRTMKFPAGTGPTAGELIPVRVAATRPSGARSRPHSTR